MLNFIASHATLPFFGFLQCFNTYIYVCIYIYMQSDSHKFLRNFFRKRLLSLSLEKLGCIILLINRRIMESFRLGKTFERSLGPTVNPALLSQSANADNSVGTSILYSATQWDFFVLNTSVKMPLRYQKQQTPGSFKMQTCVL